MKRFLLKTILFFSPLLISLFVELFILPIDFFTFRIWEAVIVKEFRSMLPGRFYPFMDITKVEIGGDIGPRSPFSVKKKMRWVTDRYGFRKKDLGEVKPQVVIVGDSSIAGTRLTQEEMLSEVLESQLSVPVYPYAPVGFNTFLKDSRFTRDPIRVVIVAAVERSIVTLPPPRGTEEKRSFLSTLREKVRMAREIQSATVLLDRLFKMNMLNWFRARIGNQKERDVFQFPTRFGPMFFLQGDAANKEVSHDQFERAVGSIEAYNRVLNEKGIFFLFLPIPNKENIYHEYLPDPRRPLFLESLIQELKRKGVPTVDTQDAFEESYRKDGTLLYHLDDTHWNPVAVKITADLIRKIMETPFSP